MEKSNCVSCDRKCQCFKLLTKDELTLINDNKTTSVYKKGENIIRQGSMFKEVISFNAGLAKMHIKGTKDKELLLGLISPSEIIGGPGLFYEKRYSYGVTALVDSIICLIDSDVFRTIFKQNSVFADMFLQSFSKRYVDTFDRFLSLTQKQMHGRLADALLFLSERFHFSDTFEIPFSQQEFGEFTAMSKESVCRILKEFKDEHIIESKGRHIKILDKEILIKIREAG